MKFSSAKGSICDIIVYLLAKKKKLKKNYKKPLGPDFASGEISLM